MVVIGIRLLFFDRKELLGLKCMYCFFIHESVRLLEVQLVRNIAGPPGTT